jgi:4-amino-4-deoxy-L-arabinose transferase-like glycosyltransferase
MSPASRLANTWKALAAGALLAVFAAQCLDLARRTSCTVDENGHLGAGVSYWANGDYRLVTSNLFFAQRFAGLGPWLGGWSFPSKAQQTALGNDPTAVGDAFLFKSGHNPVRILLAARAMVILLGVLLGVVTFFWARRVFGDVAGLGALTVFALSPPLVANASLVTTDLAAALWFTVAVWAYWRMLGAPTVQRAALAGVAFGLLALTKLTVVGFVAVAGFLTILAGWRRPRPAPWLRLAAPAIFLLAAWLTIWAFFGFTASPGGYQYPWAEMGSGTLIYKATAIARRLHLLPDPFLYDSTGLRVLVARRYSFFAGEHYHGGTWIYFPAAFALKTPPAALAAMAIAGLATLTAAWRARRGLATDWPLGATRPLWTLVLVFFALCMFSRLDIGHRHLLSIYPSLCVLAGGALAWLGRRGRWGRMAAGGLVGVCVVEAAWLHGRQHAYLSPLAGGPSQGYHWFVDSTIDWGANLPELAAWQRRVAANDPQARFYLGHLGIDSIAAYGVRGTLLSAPGDYSQWRGGYYVLSATALYMGYIFQPGFYTAATEAEYQASLLAPDRPAASPQLPGRRQQLALARLSAYCRHRAPDARIGDVYFVFRLTDPDVERALFGPLSPELLEPPMTRS